MTPRRELSLEGHGLFISYRHSSTHQPSISIHARYLVPPLALLPGSGALLLPWALAHFPTMTPCQSSFTDPNSAWLGSHPTPPSLGGGQVTLVLSTSSTAHTLQPEACVCPNPSSLTKHWGQLGWPLPEQVDVSVAVLDLIIPDAPGALLPTDDPHLLDLSCVQTCQRGRSATAPGLTHKEQKRGDRDRSMKTRSEDPPRRKWRRQGAREQPNVPCCRQPHSRGKAQAPLPHTRPPQPCLPWRAPSCPRPPRPPRPPLSASAQGEGGESGNGWKLRVPLASQFPSVTVSTALCQVC